MSESINHRALTACETALEGAKLFYRARWSRVREGDVILVPGDGEPIVEVTVKRVYPMRTDGGANVIQVYYKFGYATYGVPCDPNGVAYIQSRL